MIDKKNQADSMVYQTRKQLSELSAKLPQNIKDSVDQSVKELEEAIKSDDITKIDAATDNLQKQVMQMGQAMYNKPEATPKSEQDTEDSKNKQAENSTDKVIDADFTDNKK